MSPEETCGKRNPLSGEICEVEGRADYSEEEYVLELKTWLESLMFLSFLLLPSIFLLFMVLGVGCSDSGGYTLASFSSKFGLSVVSGSSGGIAVVLTYYPFVVFTLLFSFIIFMLVLQAILLYAVVFMFYTSYLLSFSHLFPLFFYTRCSSYNSVRVFGRASTDLKKKLI